MYISGKGGILLMEVIENRDEMSTCNNCLNRKAWAEVVININGINVKLCSNCRKEMMKQLIDIF